MTTDQTRDRLTELLTAPLAAAGLDVEAVEISPAGKRRIVRVAVDTDGGVTLDDVAAATRQVAGLLDDSDVLGEHPYTLEVTSPGTDRPLTLPRHWRRNIGRLVTVTTATGSTTGRITATDHTTATLDVKGAQKQVAFSSVTKAHIQVELNRKES